MSKQEVVIIDSKTADEIIKIVAGTSPQHICGCFGSKCDECLQVDRIVESLSKRTRMIAKSGELELDSPKIYVRTERRRK